MFAIGTKAKGPAAGVALGVGGVVAHEVLDVPVAALLLALGFI